MNTNYLKIIALAEKAGLCFHWHIDREFFGSAPGPTTVHYKVSMKKEGRRYFLFESAYTRNRSDKWVPDPEEARNFGGHNAALAKLLEGLEHYVRLSTELLGRNLVFKTWRTANHLRDEAGRFIPSYRHYQIVNAGGRVVASKRLSRCQLGYSFQVVADFRKEIERMDMTQAVAA